MKKKIAIMMVGAAMAAATLAGRGQALETEAVSLLPVHIYSRQGVRL